MNEFSEKLKNRLARILKPRFAILYPFGIWAAISAYSTNGSIRRGILFFLCGIFIRSWANCYAIKLDKLTTSGPYGHVRHPLYLGSFLIMSGFLIMLNVPWFAVLAFVLIVVGIVYKWTVQNEEHMLMQKFGEDYIEYQKAVPAFFPAIFSFKGGEKWGPSAERYLRSQEYKLVIWTIIVSIAFHIKEEILVEHEMLDVQMVILVMAALFLILLDVMLDYLRKAQKREDV